MNERKFNFNSARKIVVCVKKRTNFYTYFLLNNTGIFTLFLPNHTKFDAFLIFILLIDKIHFLNTYLNNTKNTNDKKGKMKETHIKYKKMNCRGPVKKVARWINTVVMCNLAFIRKILTQHPWHDSFQKNKGFSDESLHLPSHQQRKWSEFLQSVDCAKKECVTHLSVNRHCKSWPDFEEWFTRLGQLPIRN